MKKKSLPKNQHFVPRAYQHLFCLRNRPKQVAAFRPHDQYGPSRVENKGTKHIASIEHLYEVDKNFQKIYGETVEDGEIETRAFWYESQALVDIFTRFSGADITWDTFIEVASIAALLKLRNPTTLRDDFGFDIRTRLPQILEQAFNATLDEQLRRWPIDKIVLGRQFLRDKVAALVALENTSLEMKKLQLLKTPFKESTMPMVQEILSGKIHRLSTTKDYPFISSDNPGFTWTKSGGVQTTGFGDWQEYFFVVSPTAALVTFHPSYGNSLTADKMTSIEIPPLHVDYINSLTCWNAFQYVYGSSEDHVERVRERWIRVRAGEQIFD